jgi:large subunit ribosomal protein L35
MPGRTVPRAAAAAGWVRPSDSIGEQMPKMKTHSGAKKRFRVTAGGKIRGRHAFTTHIRGKKSAKRKRRLSRPMQVSAADRGEVRDLLAGRGR